MHKHFCILTSIVFPIALIFCPLCFVSGKIILFYLIFYTVLATLFALMLWVFYQTLDPRIPKWQTDRSLIGTNPG